MISYQIHKHTHTHKHSHTKQTEKIAIEEGSRTGIEGITINHLIIIVLVTLHNIFAYLLTLIFFFVCHGDWLIPELLLIEKMRTFSE